MNKQITLNAISDELAQAKTKKKEFLTQIERIVPWEEWEGIIEPHYYKGERGNKLFSLELMVRLHVLQNLYDLSDMATAEQVIDSRAFSDFCGIDSSNQVPDGDTIGRFRGILVNSGLQERLFAQVVMLLMERRLILKKGTIVDSTIGVDKDSGLTHHVEVTAANEHDVAVCHKLLTGEEETVHGDSGYLGAGKREDAVVRNHKGKKIKYTINRRPSQIRKLSRSGAVQGEESGTWEIIGPGEG